MSKTTVSNRKQKPMTGEQAVAYDHETVRRILERRAFKVREEDACRLPFRDSFFRIDAAIAELLAAIDEAEKLDLEYDGKKHPLPDWQTVLVDVDHLHYLATISRDLIRCSVPSSWGLWAQMQDPVESKEMVEQFTTDLNEHQARENATTGRDA